MALVPSSVAIMSLPDELTATCNSTNVFLAQDGLSTTSRQVTRKLLLFPFFGPFKLTHCCHRTVALAVPSITTGISCVKQYLARLVNFTNCTSLYEKTVAMNAAVRC